MLEYKKFIAMISVLAALSVSVFLLLCKPEKPKLRLFELCKTQKNYASLVSLEKKIVKKKRKKT